MPELDARREPVDVPRRRAPGVGERQLKQIVVAGSAAQDERKVRRQRLQRRERQPLVGRGEDQPVDGLVESRGIGQIAQADLPVADAKLPGELVHLVFQFAGPDMKEV